MGLKIGEVFRDYCCLTVTATGARAIGLVDVTCQVIDETGTAFGAAIVATECAWASGWYYADITPDAAGVWGTDWSKTLLAANYTFHYPYKEFQVGAGQEADIYARLGAPAGASMSADILAIDNFVDELEGRLTAARAGYLDNINQAGLLQITAARGGYLDNINQAGLLQLTAARAGYIDELAAANLPADVDTLKAAVIVIDEFHDVPAQNSALNAQINEVVGNKTDTTAGDSIVALAKQIKAKTDNLPADPADDSDLDTSIAAVKAETALIVADTGELQTDWVNGGRLDLLIDAIKARTDHHEITKTFFSASQISVTVTDGGTNLALPSVVLPNITGTITHVYAGFKFRMIENTNAAANKLNVTQYIQTNNAAEGLDNAIQLVDDQFGLAASTREGGDCIVGNIDLQASAHPIDAFNVTVTFQWTTADADLPNIVLNDVQTFLIVSYY